MDDFSIEEAVLIRIAARETRDHISYWEALESSLQELGEPDNDERYNREEIVEAAWSEHGIPEDVIDQVIAKLFSFSSRRASAIQGLANLKRIGSRPTLDVVADVYSREILGALSTEHPTRTFREEGARGGFRALLNIYHVGQIEVPYRDFLFRQQTRLEEDLTPLATLEFNQGSINRIPKGNFDLRISLEDPSFTDACADVLIQLREEFKPLMRDYRLSHTYTL